MPAALDGGSEQASACPTTDLVRFFVSAGLENADEVLLDVAPSGDDGWLLAAENSGEFIQLTLPSNLGYPSPPRDSCCAVRLPAGDPRREIQVFADDGLWFEVSAPVPGGESAGMHASLAGKTGTCTNLDGAEADRFEVRFDFADEALTAGGLAPGEIDGHDVSGFVTQDLLGNEDAPQAVVGRGLP